jgi:hypothetical protein
VSDDAVNNRTRALISLAVVLAVGGTLLAGGVWLGTVLRATLLPFGCESKWLMQAEGDSG